MEMSVMQQSALRSFHPAAAAGISGNQRCGGCGNSGLTICTLGSRRGLASSGWNWRASRDPARRGIHPTRSSGGSRRDEAKQVAKSQRRRSRHVKGVTPTKPELYDALQAEEEADEELDRSEEDLEAALGSSSNDVLDNSEDESSYSSNGKAKGDSNNQDVNFDGETRDQASKTKGTDSGVEEIVDAGEGTYAVKYFPEGKGEARAERDDAGDGVEDIAKPAQDSAQDTGAGLEEIVDAGDNTYVIKYFPEGKGGAKGETNSAEDFVKTAQDAAKDLTASAAQDAQEAGDGVRENLEDVGQDVGEVVDDVTDFAQDTAEDVTSTVQEAAESTGQSLSEAGDEVRENLEELGEQIPSAAAEIRDTVQENAQDVIDTAADAAQEVGESLEEAGGAVSESLDEVRGEGQKLFSQGERYTRDQIEERRKEFEDNFSSLGSQLQEAGDRAGQALEKVSNEAEKSLKNVQDSLAALVEDSAKASGTIGSEALRLGEVVLTVAGEAAGFQGPKEESSTSNGTSARKTEEKKTEKRPQLPTTQKIQGSQRKEESTDPNEDSKEDTDPYKGLKATVAGATGRTGRLLVEELSRKGVPVRALVRDENKTEARELGKLSNVEVVQVDLYKYESVKRAIGDSNVVISAVGARSFAFDPIGTYQAEFEGVKNLVAAAKNKGDVKKFVFVTSLGVTFLQIVPLIFWKKQAELYLQRSGLDYTIIRPGGLTNSSKSREAVSVKPADTQFGGSISRQKVAEVSVAALITPEASEKIVEIVSGGFPGKNYSELFASV